MANYRPGLVDVDPPEEKAPTFSTQAYSLDINVAIDIPPEVSDWFDERGHIPVEGLLDGFGIRGALVPVGERRHRMFLNEEMRQGIGIGVGDVVELVLWRDDTSREPEIPEDVRSALEQAGLLGRFLSWPPSHQREYLVVIEDAKKPETRRKRIEITVEHLTSQAGD